MNDVNVVKKKTLKAFWSARRNRGLNAEAPLMAWFRVCRKADWTNLAEARRTYPHADLVEVPSGRSAVVFNVAGNRLRVIALIDFGRRTMLVTHVLTHGEYDTGAWKADL